jgi:O-antigen/teichoic acid export membrane protein
MQMSLASASLTRLRSRLSVAVGRYRFGFAAADQIALSLFSFALNLCLVRALTATEYGIVTLWMAIGLLAIGIQDALVNTPLSTHVAATPDPGEARRLAEAIAIVNWAVTGLTTALVVLVNASVKAEWSPPDLLTAIAIPVFVAAGMIREFYRSTAYSRNDIGMLLRIDVPYLAVTSLCLAAMFLWPAQLANLAVAFLAMSAGCLIARLCASGTFRRPSVRRLRGGWIRDYRRVARDAAWALVGVLTTHLHQRSYVYVAVNLVGLAALAALNVVALLFRPVSILTTSWGRTALPDMAANLAVGRIAAFDRAIMQGFAVALAASIGCFAAIWLSWPLIERHFLAGQYPQAWLLVWPAATAVTLEAVSHVISIPLRAAREFRYMASGMVVAAPITLAAVAGAVLWQGYTWTMYGVAFGQVVVLAMGTTRLYRVRRRMIARAAAAGDLKPAACP